MRRLTVVLLPFLGALLVSISAAASTGVDLVVTVSDAVTTVHPGDRVQYSVALPW